MKLRQFSQLILLIVCASLLSITALAQDESEAKSPLELKLTARTTAFCVGSPLLLELEVMNNSQKDIETPKSHLWKQFSYALLDPESINKSAGTDRFFSKAGGMDKDIDDHAEKLILHPGQSYRATYEFQLSNDFFQEAGHYTLMMYLDHVLSNNVEFELYDCGKPQEVKEQ